MSEACGSAWASFARSGDPTGLHMPKWLPYEQGTRYTMLIQEKSELVSNYREKGRELVYRLRGKRLPSLARNDENKEE